MPLSGTYEWSQKNDLLKIKVPLKGISPSKVDIQGKIILITRVL